MTPPFSANVNCSLIFSHLTALVKSSIKSYLLLHDCDNAWTCTYTGLKPAGKLDVIFENIWVLNVASVRHVWPSASHQTHMSAEINTLHQCVTLYTDVSECCGENRDKYPAQMN